jgi:hypothetical protein
MSSIEAIGAVDQVLKLARTPNESATTQALSEKFEALMKPGAGTEHRPESFNSSNGINSVTDMMSKKEMMLNEVFADAQTFSANSSTMSMNELMTMNIDLSRRMAVANVGLQSATALGQSTNKSLQSLLKNQ